MQYAMNEEVAGVISEAFTLFGGLAPASLKGKNNVAPVAFNMLKRQNICRLILTPESVVEGAHFRIRDESDRKELNFSG